MSHHIPFEIQSDIIKRLPVKSLVQFRSVSKQWKAFIDDPKFIKTYHINHTNPQHHHLLVSCKLDDTVKTYTFIVDNNTFPQHKFPLTAPDSLSLIRDPYILASVDGLLCFCGYRRDIDSKMAIIWNPTVRKSVGIVIPIPQVEFVVVGFGVCPDTSDPKLVKINHDKRSNMWVVEVFTLSTHVWKTVYTGAPFKSCHFTGLQASVDEVIYFLALGNVYLGDGIRSNFVISFDLTSENFGEVCLPERLVHTRYLDLDVANVNGSLGLLEYYEEGDMRVCGVWTRKDDANKTFSKIYTVKVEGKSLYGVLGFSNNGEAVIELNAANSIGETRIEVYEPLSGNTNGLGISGKTYTFCVRSFMETLLLLDETDAIIY